MASVGTGFNVLGCLRGVMAFALVLVAPGQCVAWATNLLGFRRKPVVEQMLWSVALSFAVMPIAAVMAGRFGGMRGLAAVGWVVWACAAAGFGLTIWELRQNRDQRFRKQRALGFALGLAWVLFVIGELVDVGVGTHLYMSVTIFDHALRTAFVDAVMRTGVPPANPLYWPGHAAPMRYYYFWYVLTAVAARLGGVTARQAMIASAAWAGFGLAAIFGLYCQHFIADRPVGSRRRWPRVALALGLLGVAGLDILAAAGKIVAQMPTDADMDWWSPDQVTTWMASMLWVPHHVAGLVCCLLGFLLVWRSKDGQRGLCGVVAGVAFASAFGLSTWVSVACALTLAAWMVWVLVWERASRPRLPVLLGAGVVAVVLLAPYLAELRSEVSGTAGSANGIHLLRFGVRHMIDPDALLTAPGFASLARAHPQLEDALAGLILLLPGYLLELGFYGLILVVAVRARGLDEAERTALALVGVGLVVATFLRSTVVMNNDFGSRSMLVPQFFLVLLAVRWVEGGLGDARQDPTGRGLRTAMRAMLWIGVAGTIYQACALRLYLPVEDRLGRPQVSGLAERAMALQRGFAAMDGTVPKGAVVQFATDQPGDYFRYAQILLAGRQMANALPGCASAFGGEASECARIEAGVARIYSGASAESARAECARLGVSYLVATRWDPVWRDRAGWVWTLPVVVDTGEMRVAQCAGT